jgi:hypothetical protein
VVASVVACGMTKSLSANGGLAEPRVDERALYEMIGHLRGEDPLQTAPGADVADAT